MTALGLPWCWWIAGIALALVGLLAGLLIARRLPTILSPDGRRAWAFAAICGGCVVFTVFAAVGVWLNRDHPDHSLWLALAAHGQVLVGLTALGWVLGRRMQLEAGPKGAKVTDQEAQPGATATVTATVQATPSPPVAQGEME
jgi:hypothetical protein